MRLTIYAHGGHLDHVTRIIFDEFSFSYISNLVKYGSVVSEKNKF